MKVNNKNMQTIWMDNNSENIKIIDQRLLPFELKIQELNSLKDVIFAIKEMQVRGAPLIGVTASYGMYLSSKIDSSYENLIKTGEELINTRPTAVNIEWAVKKILNKIKNQSKEKNTDTILNLANQIRQDDINACNNIGNNGFELLNEIYDKKKDKVNVLTHCNAGWLATVDWGTALAPVYKAHRKGIPLHIWVDETRPRNQGLNLTAWELMNEGIPCSLVVDNTGGHLMQNKMVDVCITGTDRTTATGDVCNKIGTYLKALAAKENNIPFYVAAPISSIDFSMNDGINQVPIEVRDSEEISYMTGLDKEGKITKIRTTPTNSISVNYAFDVTPAKFINKIITEKKVVDATKNSILSLLE